MSTDDKEKVRIDELPVPIKDSNPDEEEQVKGGMGVVNPTRPASLNADSIKKPILDQY